MLFYEKTPQGSTRKHPKRGRPRGSTDRVATAHKRLEALRIYQALACAKKEKSLLSKISRPTYFRWKKLYNGSIYSLAPKTTLKGIVLTLFNK